MRTNSPAQKRTLLFAVALVALAGIASAQGPADVRGVTVRAMTQNLYVGADLFRVLAAEAPEDIPILVAQTFQTIQATNFPERAEAIADQIKKARPHLIGLQEVSLIRSQAPGDFFLGNPQPAGDVVYDYLEILLAAMRARGLRYEVAAVVNNADVELPAFAGLDGNGEPQFIDVRLSDRDVILARKNVKTSNPVAANFEVNLEVPVAGVTLPFIRGYTAVDAMVRGKTIRFVNTHLEVQGQGIVSAIQALQMQELLTVLAAESKPIVLVGDFNSSPDDRVDLDLGIVPPYLQIVFPGYVDTWFAGGDGTAGWTCCQDEVLLNPVSEFSERIDHVFFRSDTGVVRPFVKRTTAEVLGGEQGDRSPTGFWPSDHAGVAAKIRMVVLR